MEDNFVSKLRKFLMLSFQLNFGNIYNLVFEPEFLPAFLYLQYNIHF